MNWVTSIAILWALVGLLAYLWFAARPFDYCFEEMIEWVIWWPIVAAFLALVWITYLISTIKEEAE